MAPAGRTDLPFLAHRKSKRFANPTQPLSASPQRWPCVSGGSETTLQGEPQARPALPQPIRKLSHIMATGNRIAYALVQSAGSLKVDDSANITAING